MATLSNADTIKPGDELIQVKVVLDVTVNVDAWRRDAAGSMSMSKSELKRVFTVGDAKYDVRTAVLDAFEENSPFPDGIIHDVEVR